jgi:predicted nucleic acid-binding protein
MRYLLDASALLPLVTRRGKQLIVEASHENLVTTDLAIYEACNSLWKLATLIKVISLENAIDVATTIKDLIARKMIQLIDVTNLDLPQTFNKAHKEQITFYDASYIISAKAMEAILVTEDEKLLKAASKFVKTITYADLESRLIQG